MGGKSSAPAAPDYTPVATANIDVANIQKQLAEEQLQWAKDQYASDKQITDKVVNSALNTAAINDKNAASDRARYEQIYQPLEDKMVKTAKDYASTDRQSLNMGQAQANVAQQFDASRNAAVQNLESFGVDPSSARFASLDAGSRIQQAAASAGAGNQARQQTEAQGLALQSEAINVGRGYPGQVAQTYGTALQSGNQAVNSTLAGTTTGANTMGTAPQYFGGASQSLANAGNLMTNMYNAQVNAYNASNNASSGWGSALGLIGGMAMRMAEGGAVEDPNVTSGGNVPQDASPTMGKAIDDVPARLTPGEFVVPKDVSAWKGEEFFQNLIHKSRKDKAAAPAKPAIGRAPMQSPTFASGPTGAIPVG